MVVHAFNLSPLEAEAGGFQIQVQTGLKSKFEPGLHTKTVSKQKWDVVIQGLFSKLFWRWRLGVQLSSKAGLQKQLARPHLTSKKLGMMEHACHPSYVGKVIGG
jgi:hypothetical protein